MATRAKFARLAQYSREFSEAIHIFFKNGIWGMPSSLVSPCKRGWQMWASLANLAKVLANVGESCESSQKCLVNVGKSGKYLPSHLVNVGTSPHDKIVRFMHK
jgi:hypothetical protein